MEEEEREAQSAKLQELIRRGTPEDLREANRLMKVMAGYDTRTKTDYRAKAAEEVGKIQAKARLLEERLEAFKPGDTMTEGDVFEELAAALSSAQPKIQKMCEEESEDHEAVAKLLEINDSIHRTVERWKLLKKGDVEGAAKIAKGGPIPSLQSGAKAAASSSSAANELSLIDFDADVSSSNGTGNAAGSDSQAGGLENDLLGLSMGDNSTFGQGGGISLGFGANTSRTGPPHRITVAADRHADIPGPALLSSTTQNSTATGVPTTSSPPPAGFSPFLGFASAPSTSQPNTPQPSSMPAFTPPKTATPANDPFAALASPQFGSKPASPQPPPAPPAAADDDEWSFSSALPPDAPSLPKEHSAQVKDGQLRIDMKAARSPQAPNAISLSFAFSNTTPTPINELHFQLAVTKVSPAPHPESSEDPPPSR